MANLEKFAANLGVKIEKPNSSFKAKKRRAWAEDNQEEELPSRPTDPDTKQVIKPVNQDTKRDTNPVNQDTNPVIKPDIDPDLRDTYQDTKRVIKANLRSSFLSLRWGCRKMMLFIFYECVKTGDRFTPILKKSLIARSCGIKEKTVQITISRMEKKGFLKRQGHINGSAGGVFLEMSEDIFKEMVGLDANGKIKKQELEETWLGDTKRAIYQDTNAIVVDSSNFINKTTTNKELTTLGEIDYSGLEDAGFSENHLFQIEREYAEKPELALPLKIVQDSINALAFDLKHNNATESFKIAPVVALTKMLKKGKPYASKTPDKYLSPRDEAMQEYLNAKESQHLAAKDREKRVKEIEFRQWLLGLSSDEQLAMYPVRPEDHFEAKIWPERRIAILKGEAEKLAEPS